MSVTLTPELVHSIWERVDAGLQSGEGSGAPGAVCVEQAVALACGEPLSDRPTCVANADRAFLVRLNDADWPSDDERAKGLRRLAVMQLGTAGTDRRAWAKALALGTVREVLPITLDARGMQDHAARCRAATTLEEARTAAAYADDAAYAAAAAYADDAAAYAADDAAYAAAAAAYAAAAAAYAAAYAADDAAHLQILHAAVRVAEQAYEATGSPGLDLLRSIEGSSSREEVPRG